MRLQGGSGGGRRRLEMIDRGPDVRQGKPIARAAGAGRPAGMPGIRFQAACCQATRHPLREAGRRIESEPTTWRSKNLCLCCGQAVVSLPPCRSVC